MEKFKGVSKLGNAMIMKMFLSYTVTFAIVELSSKICHSIDGMMVSNLLGDKAMAAHGLTSPYTSVIEIISGIIVTGSQAMLTLAMGKGSRKETNESFSIALEVATVLAVCQNGW